MPEPEESAAQATQAAPWDANPEPPEPPRELAKHLDLEEGRGLGLVKACADLWGWQPLSRNGSKGKYVWCELTTAA